MAKVQIAANLRRYELDPLLWLWRLLTSVRFALALIFFLILASLLGVLIPQLPSQMRDNPAGVAAWLAMQRDTFGSFTGPMDRLGLFEVFRSLWFVSGLAVLVVSVSVCTMNRFAPIWRNVTRPQTRVPDEYFARGQPVVSLDISDTDSLVAGLKRKRYRVVQVTEGSTTYLFADRFPWAQFATFVSHLALILFLAGGLVTLITAKGEDILIGEGETRPAFSPGDRDHMQIYVEDAVGRFNESGFPLDYRTFLVVYKNGQEVARGVATVNDPLKYGGFQFHQTAYFPDGAALQVRDLASGRLLYDEVLALTDITPAPRIVVRRDDGRVLLDDAVVPTDVIAGAAGAFVTVPGTERSFWVGIKAAQGKEGPEMILFETSAGGLNYTLRQGEALDLGDDVSLTFSGQANISSLTRRDLPGGSAESLLELSNGPAGQVLVVTGVQGYALALAPNQPVTVDNYEYTFLGGREFTGITVRRDVGATFIWVATALLLLGLGLTFYTPRRRLWARISAGQAVFRGLGGRHAVIERELSLIVEKADGADEKLAP